MTRFDRPMWQGENPRGRHILIVDEQGLGDSLHFCRYIPMIKKLGARVSVSVRGSLVSLLETLSANIHVVKESEPLPDFDCWTHMMSLPYLFGTDFHNIPADVPYLHIPNECIAQAAQEISQNSKKKVGLVWSGSSVHKNDHNRSIPLENLQPLLAMPEFEFYILQTEIRPSDMATLSVMPQGQLKSIATPNSTFMQTAARILNLDLVILVDTSLAHLCGALGRDVWILLPVNPDWRWLLDRTDSPWYPSARLFRQREYGQWSEVIQSVRDHLLDL